MSRFKGEQPGPTHYLPPANIYGLVMHDAYNNICSVYTWTEFEGKKLMNNVESCLIHWINEKWCCYQSYGKNHKMPEIDSIIDNCGGQKNNDAMI